MAQRLEILHMGFPRQVKKLKAKRLRDGSWRKAAKKKVIQGAETQQLQTLDLIGQETVDSGEVGGPTAYF